MSELDWENRLLLSNLLEPGAKESIFTDSAAQLEQIAKGAMGPRRREHLAKLKLSTLIKELKEGQSTFVIPGGKYWPAWCDELMVPPIGLYVRGQASTISLPAISIVGTRVPSEYGLRHAGDFAYELATAGYLISSGGAVGIDAAAHRAALFAQARTLIFLAGGTARAYPARNETLFSQAADSGALISEVAPFSQAQPHRFLSRNRLIAAAGSATLVIEAAIRSGSIRTARDAAELFRLVFALPGAIDAPTSAGTNRLIADRIAELITSPSELLELVRPVQGGRMPE